MTIIISQVKSKCVLCKIIRSHRQKIFHRATRLIRLQLGLPMSQRLGDIP
jgi:hypothetical protein